MKKRLFVAFCLSALMLTACGGEANQSTTDNSSLPNTSSNSHTHSWSSEWESDATHHWHTCSGCDEISDKAAHIHNDYGFCSVCGRYLGDTVELHHETDAFNLAVGQAKYARVYVGDISTLSYSAVFDEGDMYADARIYRTNEQGSFVLVPELTQNGGYYDFTPSYDGYLYLVLKPTQANDAIVNGYFYFEDRHMDGSGNPVNVDTVGYCTHSSHYTGIDVLPEKFNHEFELDIYGYENTHDIFIRFIPREGKAYYLNANHSFDYREITCTLYGRDNDVYSSTGLTEMCVLEYGDIGGWSANYYSELASFAKGDDNYLYLHLVTGTGDENKVQAGDSFWIMETNAS